MAMGVHGFDALLSEPGYREEVRRHTAVTIREATNKLLGPDEWDILSNLQEYKQFSGLPATFTRETLALRLEMTAISVQLIRCKPPSSRLSTKLGRMKETSLTEPYLVQNELQRRQPSQL